MAVEYCSAVALFDRCYRLKEYPCIHGAVIAVRAATECQNCC
jgi:hypothetical protein